MAQALPTPRPDSAIRSVTRALALLTLLNEHEAVPLSDLQRASGLPKTTVHRLLATLCQAGYAVSDERAGAYRVTEKVRELGSGYTRRSLVVDVGAAIVKRVTREIKWPLAIGTLEGTNIVVRYSTMPYSPLAVQATTVGHRLGLLDSAMGIAYLAFCDEVQREVLLQALRQAAPTGVSLEPHLWHVIRTAQRRGYGLRLPGRRGDSATVAVPIRHEDEMLGILSMTTFGSLMDGSLLQRHVPILTQTADTITAQIAEHIAGERTPA